MTKTKPPLYGVPIGSQILGLIFEDVDGYLGTRERGRLVFALKGGWSERFIVPCPAYQAELLWAPYRRNDGPDVVRPVKTPFRVPVYSVEACRHIAKTQGLLLWIAEREPSVQKAYCERMQPVWDSYGIDGDRPQAEKDAHFAAQKVAFSAEHKAIRTECGEGY